MSHLAVGLADTLARMGLVTPLRDGLNLVASDPPSLRHGLIGRST